MRPPSRKTLKVDDGDLSVGPLAMAKPTAANSRGGTRAASRPAAASSTPRARAGSAPRRKRPAAVDASVESEDESNSMDSPATCTNANHNKYCHFCQHVKVRASSMLACENQECCRRFCEHCLQTHLNEDVDPMSSDAWSLVDGKPFWHCPICRKKCCCSVAQCEENHRHCKAYRYRRRRAELATKRTAAANHSAADKRSKKASSSAAAKPAASKMSHTTPTLMRPTVTCGYVRAKPIDSPPLRSNGSGLAMPFMAGGSGTLGNRPRREAALKRKIYNDDDDDDVVGPEITTPGAEECSTAPSSGHTMMQFGHRVHQNGIGGGGVPAGHGQHQRAKEHHQDQQNFDMIASTMWSDRETSVRGTFSHDQLTHEHDYHSDDESESMMLGGIYGHMSQLEGASLSASDMCGGDVMLLDDVHLGSAELDEARWLRRTYETVYNPSARQGALQALSGDLARAKTPTPAKLHDDSGFAWKKMQQQHMADHALLPARNFPADPVGPCVDVSDCVSLPKAPWMPDAPGPARKSCVVMYNIV